MAQPEEIIRLFYRLAGPARGYFLFHRLHNLESRKTKPAQGLCQGAAIHRHKGGIRGVPTGGPDLPHLP